MPNITLSEAVLVAQPMGARYANRVPIGTVRVLWAGDPTIYLYDWNYGANVAFWASWPTPVRLEALQEARDILINCYLFPRHDVDEALAVIPEWQDDRSAREERRRRRLAKSPRFEFRSLAAI